MATDGRRNGSRSGNRSDNRNVGDHRTVRRGNAQNTSNTPNGHRSGSNRSRPTGVRNSSGSRMNRDDDQYDNYDDGYQDDFYEDQRSSRNPSRKSGSRVTAKKSAKKKRNKIILFIAEIFLLLVMVVFLYGVLQVKETGKIVIEEDMIVINETVREYSESTLQGYRNIALFGVDSRTGELSRGTLSDTIMIASINQDTGECKLVSVYRDTYLNLGNDSYNKATHAYSQGGAAQAINMLNMNLDLNITDFVTVGFAGVTDTVDALGGVMIDVDEAEITHLNSYQRVMADEMDREYVEVTSTGYQLLTGLQATAYCRIRYTAGDDFKRAERQREVLLAILEEAKQASPATITEIAENVFGSILTSLDLSEIIEVLSNIANYEVTDNGGFPEESIRDTGNIGEAGSCVVPVNLEQNVIWLHQFLFEVDSYEPSSEVKEYSQAIQGDTDPYL